MSFRCFCRRFNWGDLSPVSNCSSNLAQRSHRSASPFQTRLFSCCRLDLAMAWHSAANFRNRSAACIIWGPAFVRCPTNARNLKLFRSVVFLEVMRCQLDVYAQGIIKNDRPVAEHAEKGLGLRFHPQSLRSAL